MNTQEAALGRADAAVAVMARILAHLAPAPDMIGGATPAGHLATLVAHRLYLPASIALQSQGRAAQGRIGWLGQEDAALLAEATGRIPLDLPEIFTRVVSGRFAIWIAPAQIDRLGNTNISRIGREELPRPALVGSRGLPDDSVSLPNGLYYVPAHGPRSVVDAVDFVSGVGDRRRLPAGSRAQGRPAYLVSDAGVFDFAGPHGAMRLRARMPGVGVEEITARTPFDVLHGLSEDEVGEVASPTDEERAAFDRLDPFGVRALEFTTDAAAAGVLRRRLVADEEADLAPRAAAFLSAAGLSAVRL